MHPVNQVQGIFQNAKQAYTRGDYVAAVKGFDQLLTQLGPRDDLLNMKALALLAMGQLEAAASAISKAIKLNPNMAGMHLNAARIYTGLSQTKQVKRHINDAVKLSPREPSVLYQAALLSRECNDYSKAQRILERCLQVQPDFALAWHLQGATLIDLGQFEDARKALEKAVELEPGNAKALSALIKLRGDSLVDTDSVAMLEKIRASDAAPADRGSATFSLAHLYRRDNQFQKAFELYHQANQLTAPTRPFGLDAWMSHVDSLIAATSPESQFVPHQGSAGANLVFIVGMPRSGTSLSEQVLSASPQVMACGELAAMQHIEVSLYRQGVNPYADAADNQKLAKALKGAADLYLDNLPKDHQKFAAVIDKAPMNFDRLGMIHQIFPAAKFIYCQRHPLDTILSCYMQDFHAGLGFAFDLEQLSHVYVSHVRLMEHWQRVLPDSIYVLDYESMVSYLETQSRKLADFLNIPFDPAMLKPHLQERAVVTASNVQVRQPVYTSSIGNWENYRTELDSCIQILQKHDILDEDLKPIRH